MATEVLLTADVKDVGAAGEVVRVADGYARNYLLPRKLATAVTAGQQRRIAKLQEKRQAEQAAAAAAAREIAAKLVALACTIHAKAASDEKLYGSVGAAEIVAALAGQGVALTKDQIQLDAPLKTLGLFDVTVRLHADVSATLKVRVVEE